MNKHTVRCQSCGYPMYVCSGYICSGHHWEVFCSAECRLDWDAMGNNHEFVETSRERQIRLNPNELRDYFDNRYRNYRIHYLGHENMKAWRYAIEDTLRYYMECVR